MQTRIYLVRHGQTAWNAELRCQGHMDVPLDEDGRRQARELAERMSGLPIRAVFSSDLIRAGETAEFLAAPHNLRPVLTPALRERQMGVWEGLTVGERESRWPHLWVRWEGGEKDPPGLNLEPYAAMVERLLGELGRLAREYRGSDVAAVTHGGCIFALLETAGVSGSAKRPFLQNCAVTPFATEDGRHWRVDDSAPVLGTVPAPGATA